MSLDLVFYNGALAWERDASASRHGRRVAWEALLGAQAVTELRASWRALTQAALGVEWNDTLYAEGSFARHFPDRFCTPYEFDIGAPLQAHKVLLELLDDAVREAYVKGLPPGVVLLATDGGTLGQLMSERAGKSAAVAALIGDDALRHETLAFGDDVNDLCLFRAAKCAVSMGNAATEVKETATRVTATNDDEGVVKALRALGLA